MKISYRILLINFAVVVAILTGSAVVIYSVMYNIVTAQQSRYLVNSADNFSFSYRSLMDDCEEEFLLIEDNHFTINSPELQKNIDFILTAADSESVFRSVYAAKKVNIPDSITSLSQFIESNPYAIVKRYKSAERTYFFGRVFNEEVLNLLSKRIGSEVAIIWDNSAIEISNSSSSKQYFDIINQAYTQLKSGETGTYTSDDLAAVRFNPLKEANTYGKLQFVIFTPFSEASELRYALVDVLLLSGLTGVVLSLILTMIFTDKIRKQIKNLSKATEQIKEGDFTRKIEVKSKDELGKLGTAFNTMLDVLARNEQQKNEYSDFITLINQNPTLKEISDAALSKITKACGYAVGALYIVEESGFNRIALYGMDNEFRLNKNPELFNTVIKKREPIEVNLEEEYPGLVSGFVKENVKHLLVLPVIYNNKAIAVIELGSITQPSDSAREYLSRIQEQLAIGITNAIAFIQLENVVSELKKLNEEYQIQNLQVRKQNETLVALHNELKEKADELIVQKLKAEESTQLKSQFLASMSHELRTPMNSILGLTELILEESSLAGKNRERLEVVLKSSRRLMNIINDILDLSKIEAGKMEIHEEDVLLEEIISEVETSVSPLTKNKKIEFRVERELSTHIMITTDRGKLMQILINLLGNALKFTEKGSVELKISSPSEDKLKFTVRDTGIGISEKDKQIIFEEFRQVDGTTARKYDGTGLGLTISSRLCHMLKGNLSLESVVGEGSTFTLTIPFKKSDKQISGINKPLHIEALVRNRKNPVLVIDDDEEVRFTIGQYLNSKGYEVIFADSGYKGVSEAIKVQPFAVILDLMLPDKDGWTTLNELKQNALTRDIPVILISVIGDRKAGYGLGAFEYFVKPIAHSELISCLRKMENLASKRIKNIVIVDDDELEFEKFRREFKKEKIRIHYIRDSEFAFSKILEIQPDLVIIDLLMPSVDGITLSHKLKSNKDTRHIPIIISTAKNITEREKEALQDIVENITVKSKGHPLDVLKVVRDRIRMQEMYSSQTEDGIIEAAPMDLASSNSLTAAIEPVPLEVLIVDDDPDALYTLDEIVQSCDCKTLLAKDGYECLKILEEETPDIILLDIMMPGMDGFQTLKKIRSNRKWDNIPVYAVTAKAMIEDKGIIMKHGFDDYLFKPINAGILVFKLKKLLFKLRVNQ
jgi:signal transduction histidine kinase/DNA-binding response OmpR family regulator